MKNVLTPDSLPTQNRLKPDDGKYDRQILEEFLSGLEQEYSSPTQNFLCDIQCCPIHN